MTTMTTRAISQDTPAIAGGTPAKTTPFARAKRYGSEELEQLEEALDQQTLFYAQGTKVKALEAAFAQAVGAGFAVATSSGTSALHAALIALGISPGDEVITTPITDIGTLVPILYQNAVPVFADLDPHTYNLDPQSVAARVSPRTRAIVAVHLAGNACDLSALQTIADRHNLFLIEDCAQAHGCAYEGRPVGTTGQIGCFSFNEFKHIACGDGGVAVTRDPQLAHRLRLATDKGYDRSPDALVRQAQFLANNYRLTELQGAVALAQLPKLGAIVARRRAWCGQLSERLAGIAGLSLPRITPGCDPSWWFYLLRVIPDVLTDADAFAAGLRAEGLPASAHYIGKCIYEYPLFADHCAFARSDGAPPPAYASYPYHHGQCPTAESILNTGVQIAINEGYSQSDLDESVRAIDRLARWFQHK